jgi:hypothetical protein
MRKFLIVIAALAASVTILSVSPNRAEAMTLPAPIAIQNAMHELGMTEEVAYVCRRRCSYYGCVRRCYYTRGYYRPYRAYRPYRYYRYY